MLIAKLDLSK